MIVSLNDGNNIKKSRRPIYICDCLSTLLSFFLCTELKENQLVNLVFQLAHYSYIRVKNFSFILKTVNLLLAFSQNELNKDFI